MRQAHPLSLTAMALLMAGASPLVFAQSPEPASVQPSAQQSAADARSVFSPAAPTLALKHQPLPASGDIVAQPGDWKTANAAVGEFPRGHGDVLKWEKAQATAAGKAAEPAAPAQGHHHHGGLQ